MSEKILQEKPLSRMAVLFGIVTLGLAQSFYGIVLAKPNAFPQNILFSTWVIFFLQVIPFVLLLAADTWIKQKTSGRFYVLWRSFLAVLLFVSMFRQFQVFSPSIFGKYFSFVPPIFLYAFGTMAVFLVFSKWYRNANLYLTYLGFSSILFPVYFLVQGDMLRFPDYEGKKTLMASEGVPIVFIVFDELSLDVLMEKNQIDKNSFPNFAAFADDSIWFRNATTNHWATVDSIPSMITGRKKGRDSSTLFQLLPDYSGIFISAEIEVENWFLSHASHRGVKIIRGKGTFLTRNPLRTFEYITGRLLGYVRFVSGENIYLDDPAYHVTFFDQVKQALEVTREAKRTFLFFHPSVPHSPFIFDEQGSLHRQNLNYFPFQKEYDPGQFQSIYHLYRKQVQYADRLLGEFLGELKRAGLYERSIVIVTSDHGLRVWGDLTNHGELVAHIPVMIRFPGKQAKVSDTDFQVIDIAPTLMAGLKRPFPDHAFEGISGGSASSREKWTYYYPSRLAYDSVHKNWINLNTPGKSPSMIVDANQRKARDAFSTVYVFDDLLAAQKERRDFFELYLNKDFPVQLPQSKLQEIQMAVADASVPATAPQHFRRAMNHFYLAIWDSYWMAKNGTGDIATINQHWRQLQHHLERSGEISFLFKDQVQQFLSEADSNGDRSLNKEEVTEMIRSRLNRN